MGKWQQELPIVGLVVLGLAGAGYWATTCAGRLSREREAASAASWQREMARTADLVDDCEALFAIEPNIIDGSRCVARVEMIVNKVHLGADLVVQPKAGERQSSTVNCKVINLDPVRDATRIHELAYHVWWELARKTGCAVGAAAQHETSAATTESVSADEALEIATPCSVIVDGAAVQVPGKDCGRVGSQKAEADGRGIAISSGGNVVIRR